MPRLGKKARQEWAFFISPRTGRRTYNKFCRGCVHGCKQSCRAEIVECRKYQSKRGRDRKGFM